MTTVHFPCCMLPAVWKKRQINGRNHQATQKTASHTHILTIQGISHWQAQRTNCTHTLGMQPQGVTTVLKKLFTTAYGTQACTFIYAFIYSLKVKINWGTLAGISYEAEKSTHIQNFVSVCVCKYLATPLATQSAWFLNLCLCSCAFQVPYQQTPVIEFWVQCYNTQDTEVHVVRLGIRPITVLATQKCCTSLEMP